ncbi:MAG: hypothetical protein ABI042_19655 [Verrucomicrobiota bacterium]
MRLQTLKTYESICLIPNSQAEITIARERLHWGIFILPLLVFLVAAIPEIILINVFKNLFATLGQIDGSKQPQRSFFWLYAGMIFVGALPGVLALLGAWLSYTKSELLLTSKRLMFRPDFSIKSPANYHWKTWRVFTLQNHCSDES